MVNTNALLSFAFAVVSNFVHTVHTPPLVPPQRAEDLSRYHIGSPSSPVDVIVVDCAGNDFMIGGGVVSSFHSPRSVFGFPQRYADSIGEPALSEEQVVELGERTLRSLALRGDPLAGAELTVRKAGHSQDKLVPFYKLQWTSPAHRGDSVANVEIDASTGTVVSLFLLDRGFFDSEKAQALRNRFYLPDPAKPQPLRKRVLPIPSKEQVADAIPRWLSFCRKLGLEPGAATTFEQMDVERSCIYTSERLGTMAPVCRIAFTNRTFFECVGGVVFNHFCSDAFYSGDDVGKPTREEVQGTINYRWQELAAALESRAGQELSIPGEMLRGSKAVVRYFDGTPLGSRGTARAVIVWEVDSPPSESTAPLDPRVIFTAEFDLNTGQTKCVSFRQLSLLGWRPSDSHP